MLVILQVRHRQPHSATAAHHRAALDAVIFDDASGVFLRRFTGIFVGDSVKNFLFDQMLGGGQQRGEAEAQAQKDFHAG